MARMTVDELADRIFSIEYECQTKLSNAYMDMSGDEIADARRKANKRLRAVNDAEWKLDEGRWDV